MCNLLTLSCVFSDVTCCKQVMCEPVDILSRRRTLELRGFVWEEKLQSSLDRKMDE